MITKLLLTVLAKQSSVEPRLHVSFILAFRCDIFVNFNDLCYYLVAYLNMGTSLIILGRCDEAAMVFLEGSKLEGVGLRDRPAHENARMAILLQLGALYAEQGKLQRALAVYREALHKLPSSYPPQVGDYPKEGNREVGSTENVYFAGNLSATW